MPYDIDEETVFAGDLLIHDIGAVPGMTIDLPIRISGVNNFDIYSFKANLSYDQSQLLLDTIRVGDYLDDFMMMNKTVDDGIDLFAAYGLSANQNSDIVAIATFMVLEEFSDLSTITISAININDQNLDGYIVSANVSYSLGIDGAIPEVFSLHQNYPNPFNPLTKIRYDLPKEEFVNITIYDFIGSNIKSLVNKEQAPGFKTTFWNATNDFGEIVPAGMYIYRIQAGEFSETKKMVLLK